MPAQPGVSGDITGNVAARSCATFLPRPMPIYAISIALSSFLSFAIQPAIAKMILPSFGGSSAVWSTCMLFFQAVLLLGYLYAHWLHRRLAPRPQALIHIAMLVVSLSMLPIFPNPAGKTAAIQQPSMRVLALLSASIGLPCFLLSSTSPLVQAWYARTHRSGMPYRLFALSNFASLLALLSYPFLIEPYVPVRMQGNVWSAAYACFAALCAFVAWQSSRAAEGGPVPGPAVETGACGVSWERYLMWLGLAASPSVLLLSVSAHLTKDVAAFPFLWILPLV
jgi:hypothetical protein